MAQTSAGNPDVPDMGRRQFMNLLTFGTVTGVALGALYPVVNYFIPPSSAPIIISLCHSHGVEITMVSIFFSSSIFWKI